MLQFSKYLSNCISKFTFIISFFFQLETLGGEFVTISKNPETNKVRVFSLSGEANVKVANIKTKFGLVHVVDTVFT